MKHITMYSTPRPNKRQFAEFWPNPAQRQAAIYSVLYGAGNKKNPYRQDMLDALRPHATMQIRDELISDSDMKRITKRLNEWKKDHGDC